MRIVIACSNSWFQACLDTLKVDELLKISTKEELNLEVLDDFQPDFVFFPHWSWLVDEEIYEPTDASFFTLPRFRMEEEVARYKI